PDGRPHHFIAASFDELVDSPLVAGDPTLDEFEVEGVHHVLATFEDGGVFDRVRAAVDLQTLTATQVGLWGTVPYDRYLFLNVLGEAGGGLEHKNSTLMLAHRWVSRQRDTYLDWLGLVSHELFPAWNVKRLRPRGLGPFDYEREVHTPSLWIAEGLTS